MDGFRLCQTGMLISFGNQWRSLTWDSHWKLPNLIIWEKQNWLLQQKSEVPRAWIGCSWEAPHTSYTLKTVTFGYFLPLPSIYTSETLFLAINLIKPDFRNKPNIGTNVAYVTFKIGKMPTRYTTSTVQQENPVDNSFISIAPLHVNYHSEAPGHWKVSWQIINKSPSVRLRRNISQKRFNINITFLGGSDYRRLPLIHHFFFVVSIKFMAHEMPHFL